jgi:hypothetical protein
MCLPDLERAHIFSGVGFWFGLVKFNFVPQFVITKGDNLNIAEYTSRSIREGATMAAILPSDFGQRTLLRLLSAWS